MELIFRKSCFGIPQVEGVLTFTDDISTLAHLSSDEWILCGQQVTNILPIIEHQVNREFLVQEQTCFPTLLHQAIQKEDQSVLVKHAGLDVLNGNLHPYWHFFLTVFVSQYMTEMRETVCTVAK